MNNETSKFDQAAVNEYHDYTDNRANALALLKKLNAREAEGMAVTKIFWKDQQPTLVQSSSEMYWEARLQPLGRPETKGLPATDSNPRVASSWERKRDSKNRRAFTMEDTPTMSFKTSGQLPAHYYMDESALEAYVESLTNEK